MSGSNFIHGIVLIGAMVVLGHAQTPLEKALGFLAVVLGAGNAAGGLRGHRAHAGNVQAERAQGGKDEPKEPQA